MRVFILLFLVLGAPLAGTAYAAESEGPDADSPASPAVSPQVEAADQLILNGEYDKAIDLLESVIQEARRDLASLEQAYVVLVQVHVIKANDFQTKGDDKTADLWRDKAREKVRECLTTRELRHTRPDSTENYYTEMNQLFTEVRNEIQGSLRIAKLTPPQASVVLDGDTLFVGSNGMIEEEDIPAGERLLVIRADGYETLTETLVILPGTRHEQEYDLEKKKNAFWYVSRVGVPVVAAAGVIAALVIDNPAPAEEEQPLPGPPPPP